jgi:hypothetical protein
VLAIDKCRSTTQHNKNKHKNKNKTYRKPSAASINSFQAIVPYMGQEKGSFFYGGVSPSKIGLIAPY